jgi:hypothetical protein
LTCHAKNNLVTQRKKAGSSTLKRGGGSLVTKTGVQTYSS